MSTALPLNVTPFIPSPVPPAVTRPCPKLLAFGDSLVYGYGDVDGGGWVERLRRRWMHQTLLQGDRAPVLYNLGVRGDGVEQVTRRLEMEFSQRGERRHDQPDGIILSVGTNDSPRLGKPTGRNFLALEAFESAIALLLENAQRLAPVVFVGMTPVDETAMPFLDCLYYHQADQARYNSIIRDACQRRQIPHLDLYHLWLERGESWWRSRLGADGLHPNSSGYAAILEDVLAWDALSQWTSPLA